MPKLETLLVVAPVLLFSVIAHEIAHGYAALRQGDTTARDAGRLTWNPIPHIDLWMTVLLPLVLLWSTGTAVGGAKPVPVNPRNFRNYRRGDIIVSLAGVATNLAIAVGSAILLLLVGALGRALPQAVPVLAVVQSVCFVGVLINASLIAFNLIPIPPLDGSHVVRHALPPAWAVTYQRIGFAGILILLLLIRTPLFDWWMRPVFLATAGVQQLAQRLGLALPALVS